MDSFSKFLSRSVTIMGGISGSLFVWAAATSTLVIWDGLAILALGSAAAGGMGWIAADRRLKREHAQRRERVMIAAAKQERGRVTDVELVAATRYPLEECRAFLKEMTASGSAEMHIGKEGTVVYLFPGFLSEDEKRRAQSAGEWTPEPRRTAPSESPPPLESTRSLEFE